MIAFAVLPSFLSIMLVNLFAQLPAGASILASDDRIHLFGVSAQLNPPVTPNVSTSTGLGSLFGSSLVHRLAPLWPQPDSLSVTHPGFSYLATGISKLSDRVARTKQALMYAACEARPPIIYSQVTLLTFWAVYEVRGLYCMPYYRAKRTTLIPAPPTLPSTTPPSPTEGLCLVPTRTFATSLDRPAEPTPAHAWLKHGMNACEDAQETAPLSPSPLAPTSVDEPLEPDARCRPSPLQEIRAVLDNVPAKIEHWLGSVGPVWARFQRWQRRSRAPFGTSLVENVLILFLLFFLGVIMPLRVHYGWFNYGWFAYAEPLDDDHGPAALAVIHYSYRLAVKAERLEGDSLEYASEWVVSGNHDHRLELEQRGWTDVGDRLRWLQSSCTDEVIVVGVEVTRVTTVFDVVKLSDGTTIPAKVDELCAGPETFWSQTWFMSDSDFEVQPAHIDEVPDASLHSLGLGGQD
ncbi:hypothetical protein RhiJN_08114 [Ceratobasidium sp. AG-Ba]|nr:hypothetical protein RhiJN_08114 [Ceratobasidium sp. AG-Ba]QRW08872.1 hypothetical protein RhiLY_07871 [Ceratobasidium sp. AG-Ba]